jgi:hypothetical protein
MAWGSSVPGVLTALVDRLQTAEDLSGVKVWDGPVMDGSSPLEAITVGLAGDGDVMAVEGQDAREGLGTPSREQYTVHCLLEVRNGRGDVGKARARVFELLNAVGGVLATTPRLDGTAASAQPGSWSYSQAQDSSGVLATISLGVNVEAFTTR